MTDVTIVSFGYLHGEPPPAHITLDLRHHFRDPHVSPELRYMTAADELVQQAVLGTPGVTSLVAAVADAVNAFATGPSAGSVTVADGCAGGRHRAPAFAHALADQLTASGHTVTLQHRDMHRPVVNR
ncbi:ATPase [Streptomyces anulatus]|uniref:RapZ C-terminal domain-containing protein n=1 Tax=Streptomyces anulatus TaxID=1892 RepID=UPI00386DE2B2|nr:ATPase [Streptomyces anulatus]